jgi:chromosome partitioning protein
MRSGSAPIVVLTTFKGGSGKSTAAACLACHLHEAGKKVALIDADPQRSLVHWHGLGDPPLDLAVIADASESVSRTALEQAKKNDLVVVDTAGFRNRTVIEALGVADLALVPVKASPLDIAAAMETMSLIDEIAATAERGRPLPAALVLSQVTGGSVIARHIRAQLELDGVHLLQTEFVNRVTYAEAALSGRIPFHVDPDGPAAREGAKFALEVLKLLQNKKA